MMTNEEIQKLAERAEREGDKELAAILYVYLGAKKTRREQVLALYIAGFAQSELYNMDYSQWMKDGGK